MADDDNTIHTYQYTTNNAQVVGVRMKKALADVVQAQKAVPGIPMIGRNVTPRTIQLELNQKVIQQTNCSPIKIVVPSVKLPMWTAPPAVIPIIRNNVTNVMIPIKRQGEVTIPIKPQ